MDRRDFTKGLLATVTSFALMDSLFATNAIGKSIKPITDHWALQLEEYCQDLRKDAVTPLEWQQKMRTLFKQVDLPELLKFIDFEQLIKGFEYPDLGVATRAVQFPRLEGLPERTVFTKKVFGMKKDRAIIPHGHSNMVSSHLILDGEMRLRHYEKLQEEDGHLIIKPTIDRAVSVGDQSSISDDRDNVHWFVANTDQAFTFDVIMLDLNQQQYDIHNLDIYEATDLHNGSLRVPVLDVQTALKKYGKHHH